jgi:nucleotide-binding universal stress UspA family protein
MYKRILLAYDGSKEGRAALREGALLAKHCNAEVYLLSVIDETPGLQMAEAAYAGAIAHQQETQKTILEEGVTRLAQLGFTPIAKLARGQPVQVISAFAREIGADLVVVSHRRQSVLERWWSGSTGAALSDHIGCSLLIARNVISDEAFKVALDAMNPG